MNGKTQFNLWYWVAAFIGLMVFQTIFSTATQVAQIPYSEFETHLEAGRVAEVQVSDNYVQGTFRQPLDGGRPASSPPASSRGWPNSCASTTSSSRDRSRAPSCATCSPGSYRWRCSSACGCS